MFSSTWVRASTMTMPHSTFHQGAQKDFVGSGHAGEEIDEAQRHQAIPAHAESHIDDIGPDVDGYADHDDHHDHSGVQFLVFDYQIERNCADQRTGNLICDEQRIGHIHHEGDGMQQVQYGK